jgi:GT2 family glycosyltransferase
LHPDLIEGIADAPCIEATLSVIIPTLNAGPEFGYLLRKLRTQIGVRRIEIVIVDSGSTDATVSMARAAGATVIEIAPAEFSHSGARNRGADNATGEFLLFMVQDAYPIGDRWAYGLLSYLKDHAQEGLTALSCTEYCRDDSDMMYECSIANHYRFLGCKEFDRIGVFRGADQESLRSMGQLSDVSCLIPRERFQQYRYRGNFAEDLDLGVRLIRDGHRIAMLASIKVIHSHNRTSYYYLKRTFVDITFLVNVFPDFALPRCDSSAGLIAGAIHVSRLLSGWVIRVLEQGCNGSVYESAMNWLLQLRNEPFDGVSLPVASQLGDARVDAFLLELADASRKLPTDGTAYEQDLGFRRSAQYFIDDFVMRFDHFNRYASPIYQGEDDRLLREWTGAAGKTFAASLGFTLAVLYLDRRDRPESDAERQWLDRVAQQLIAGV